MAKKIDLRSAKTVSGSRYPHPYDGPCAARFRRCLGEAAGLTHFGVNLTRLPAGEPYAGTKPRNPATGE